MNKYLVKLGLTLGAGILITGTALGANAGPNEIQVLAGKRCDEAQEMSPAECEDTRNKAKKARA